MADIDKGKIVETLHDHHKDTFKYIRDREKQRDRLFLMLLGLLDLILIQVQYSTFTEAFEVDVAGIKANLAKIPCCLILSMSWTFLLALMLRYFQVAIHIDRQFDYLHGLEAYISELLGPDAQSKQIYRRESTAYLVKKGSHFRDLVWIFYSFIFPLIVVVALVWAGIQEYSLKTINSGNKFYDLAIAVAGLISILFYSFRYGWPTITFPNLGPGKPPQTPPTSTSSTGP